MTEKRFSMDYESDIIEFDWNTNEFVDEFRWGDGKSWDKVCNRLNELHDENKQLHRVIEENEKMIQSIGEELLKLRIIKKNLREIKTKWNWIMESVDYD